jgi:hypothetical protein
MGMLTEGHDDRGVPSNLGLLSPYTIFTKLLDDRGVPPNMGLENLLIVY